MTTTTRGRREDVARPSRTEAPTPTTEPRPPLEPPPPCWPGSWRPYWAPGPTSDGISRRGVLQNFLRVRSLDCFCQARTGVSNATSGRPKRCRRRGSLARLCARSPIQRFGHPRRWLQSYLGALSRDRRGAHVGGSSRLLAALECPEGSVVSCLDGVLPLARRKPARRRATGSTAAAIWTSSPLAPVPTWASCPVADETRPSAAAAISSRPWSVRRDPSCRASTASSRPSVLCRHARRCATGSAASVLARATGSPSGCAGTVRAAPGKVRVAT